MSARSIVLWIFLSLGCIAGWAATPNGVFRLDGAVGELHANGVETLQQTTLPYAWDYWRRGTNGSAKFDIAFPLPVLNAEVPYGLYIPRLGNAYEVKLNGALLERNGSLHISGGADFAQQPRHIAIPPNLLARTNLLQVQIRTDTGRRGGLSELYIGPSSETIALYQRAFHSRVTGTVIVTGFSFFAGLLALVLWTTQTEVGGAGKVRRDPLYLYAGLAELSWTGRVGDALLENPPLSWPLWGVVPVVAMGAWIYCMSLFCIHAANWNKRREAVLFGKWIALLAWLSGPLAYVALSRNQPLILSLWYATELVSFLVFGAFFVLRSLRQTQWPSRWIAFSILLNVAVGARDFYAFRIAPSYPDNSWMRYSSTVFGLALGYFVVTRFHAATAQALDLLTNMSMRMNEKELALRKTYARLEALALEEARNAERASILRDMHDGVGAHISSAIRQVQSGVALPDQVLQTLRDSLDQLKLTIDSIQLPAGDIVALLANLRYRLSPRLENSGIQLHWDVDLLEPVERLTAQDMRHVQFIVLEVFSNVLQHSGADLLGIGAKAYENGLRICITDNGKGFDILGHSHHNGLASLHERARAIGAQLTISSRPGETVVGLYIER